MIIDAEGFYVQKTFPDGRHVGVVPLTYGRARITIGDSCCVDNSW